MKSAKLPAGMGDGATVRLTTGSVFKDCRRMSRTGSRWSGVLVSAPPGYPDCRQPGMRLAFVTMAADAVLVPGSAPADKLAWMCERLGYGVVSVRRRSADAARGVRAFFASWPEGGIRANFADWSPDMGRSVAMYSTEAGREELICLVVADDPFTGVEVADGAEVAVEA